MRKFTQSLLLFAMVAGSLSFMAAQDQPASGEPAPGTMGPPKVLVIFREFLKPGKAGSDPREI